MFVASLSFNGELLDHSSQPRRKEESNRSQYTHQDKHPEEYPVNDHGHILPVLFHLAEERDTAERGHFNFHTTQSLYFSSSSRCQFSPLNDFSRMADFFIMRHLSPKCQYILAHLLMTNSRSNSSGPFVPKMGVLWLDKDSAW